MNTSFPYNSNSTSRTSANAPAHASHNFSAPNYAAKPVQSPQVSTPAAHSTKVHSLIQWVSTVVATVLIVLLLIFCVQNVQDIRICFLSWGFLFPLSLALILAFFLGAGLVIIAAVQVFWHQKKKNVKTPNTSA